MPRLKDTILEKDKSAKNILSLNILLAEMMPKVSSEDVVDPKDFKVYSSRFHTRFLYLRFSENQYQK